MMSIVPTLLVAVVTFMSIVGLERLPLEEDSDVAAADLDLECPASCVSIALQLASFPAEACSSAVRKSIATSMLHQHAKLLASAAGSSIWRPEPAMSWPEWEARRVLRRTSGTSHQVIRNKNNRHIPSITILRYLEHDASGLAVESLFTMHEVRCSNHEIMHIF
jgi:hypothetical protein